MEISDIEPKLASLAKQIENLEWALSLHGICPRCGATAKLEEKSIDRNYGIMVSCGNRNCHYVVWKAVEITPDEKSEG